MRFMLLMIPRGYETAAPDTMPSADAVAAMMAYNDVTSRAEAIAWATRCPASSNEIIEVRQVEEIADLPSDVQAVLDDYPALEAL